MRCKCGPVVYLNAPYGPPVPAMENQVLGPIGIRNGWNAKV